MEQNLNQYRLFYDVAKSGSISKASREMYISQPAVSKSLSKLEDSLGVQLLKRTRKGVMLTEEGSALFEQLEIAFGAIEMGERRLKNLKELGVGKLKIGVSASLCRYVLLPYLKGFIGENPYVRVTIDCQSSARSARLLGEGRTDVAFVVKPEREMSGEFYPICELEDIFVAAPSYIENLKNRLSQELTTSLIFAGGDLMLLDEENVTRVYVDEYLKANGIEVNKFLEVTTMDLLIEFAKIGMGIACVIRSFVARDIEEGRLVELPLETPLKKRTAGFIFPPAQTASKTAQKFACWVKNNH